MMFAPGFNAVSGFEFGQLVFKRAGAAQRALSGRLARRRPAPPGSIPIATQLGMNC